MFVLANQLMKMVLIASTYLTRTKVIFKQLYESSSKH